METHTACLDLAPFQPAEVAAISRDSLGNCKMPSSW